MSLKSLSYLKQLAAQKQNPVDSKVIDAMCNRGFLVPQGKDGLGSDLYDDYFVENETAFNRISSQYYDTISYYTPNQLYKHLVSYGVVDISEGAIEKMAKEKYIDGYKINNHYLFKPELLDNIDTIKQAFSEMEKDEELAELENDELDFPDEPEEGKESQTQAEQEENELLEEEFWVESKGKKKPKRKKESRDNSGRVPMGSYNGVQYEGDSEAHKDGQRGSSDNSEAVSKSDGADGSFARYNKEELRRREERIKFEEEEYRKQQAVISKRQSQPQSDSHAPLKDEHGHITFTGYGSEAKEADSFAVKVKVSEIATSNILSQNGLNEIIDYARTHKTEIKVPMKDGSYLQVEPTSAEDYKVSVVRSENDGASVKKDIVFSSLPADQKSNFAAITDTYAESMGVERLESGYQDKKQESTDNKVLYAVGVVPSNQAFAPLSDGDSHNKDYSSVVIPESVEFVNPQIIARFENDGVESFQTKTGKVEIESFNTVKVNENSIVSSAYLGSDAHIAQELSRGKATELISNAASENERKAFAEKVRVSEITENTVVSESAINRIAETVKSEGGKVELPLQNGNLMVFEATPNSSGNDLQVTLYSATNKDYTSPNSQLLYSSSVSEKQAVKFGDVYSAYAEGMSVERLESYNNDPEKIRAENNVLYAVGAVAKKEILSATHGDTFYAPKGVEYVNTQLLNRLPDDTVSVNINGIRNTVPDYKSSMYEVRSDMPIQESVYLGDYKNIERLMRKDDVSEAFRERYNIKTQNHYNEQATTQRTIGSLNSERTSRDRHNAPLPVAKGISAAIKTAVAVSSVRTEVNTHVESNAKEKELVDNILKNGMLSEGGFYALMEAAQTRTVDLPLENGSRIMLEPQNGEDGDRTIRVSLADTNGNVKLISENAESDGSSIYSSYMNAKGITSKNEDKMLFAVGAVTDGKLNELIKDGAFAIPKGVSYINPETIARIEQLGVKNVSMNDGRSVSVEDYKRAVSFALGNKESKRNSEIGRRITPKSSIITANTIGENGKTVLIPQKKGYLLSYTENGRRVNLSVLGNLRDDSTAFKPAKNFGIERQIGQANSRIKSISPDIYAEKGSDGKIHIRMNPLAVQQRHQAYIHMGTQEEIVRLASKQNGFTVSTQSNITLFEMLKNPSSNEEAAAAVLAYIKVKNKVADQQLEDEEKKENKGGGRNPNVDPKTGYSNGKENFKPNYKTGNDVDEETDDEANPIIVVDDKKKTPEYIQSRIAAMGARRVMRQMGRLSGLTQGRDYFTTGCKILFGYNSPANVAGDLTALSQKSRKQFEYEDGLRRELLTDDLTALGFDGFDEHSSGMKAGIELCRLNKKISASSKDLFNGKDITRLSTYQMKKILKEGKFDGSELTSEQRTMLLAALKIKSHSIGDMSAFNIADNLRRKNIFLPRNYNLGKIKDVRMLLKDLDDISASATFSRLLDNNRLSALDIKQLKMLAENAEGKVPTDLQELSKAYLAGKTLLKNDLDKRVARRRRFSRMSMIMRRTFSSADFMTGINTVLMPIEYARLMKAYAKFTVAFNRSIFYTVRRMYRATFQKFWQKTALGKFNQRAYAGFSKWRNKRKAEKALKRSQKQAAKLARKIQRHNKTRKAIKRRMNAIKKRHPGINKVSQKIGKVTDKSKNLTSKLSDKLGRLKKIGNIASKSFKVITDPIVALDMLKQKLAQKTFEKLLLPVMKWVVIALVALTLLEGLTVSINMVLASAQSTIWTQGESDSEEDVQDDINQEPGTSLMRNRVDLCLGLDSALKIYTEVMCDAESYNTSWGETENTAIKSVLESEGVKSEVGNWYDPKADKYGNVINLGYKVNGIQTGIHYSYYDGDGNEIGLQSNAKDIMAVASSWMWQNYKAKGLFKSYVEKLWNYSHAVAYNPREIEGNPDGKYIYGCEPADLNSPCHDNLYEYRCNDSSAAIYDKNNNYAIKSVKIGTGEEIMPYREKGCVEHNVTYHGGKGSVYTAKAYLNGCKNIKETSIPYGNNGTRKMFYCGGCSDCTDRCRGTERHETGPYYHNSFETVYRNGVWSDGTNPRSHCSNYTTEVTYATWSYKVRYNIPSECLTASQSSPFCYCSFADHNSQITSYSEMTYVEYVKTTCRGHNSELFLNTCEGYCDGHECHYCTGHIDLDISMVTLFLDDENGLTKLGMPTAVTTETKTVKDELGEEYAIEIQNPAETFVPLYKSVAAFGKINSSLPLPDSDSIKDEVKMKLAGIDNVTVGSNETVDTLRFFWMFKEGKKPYEDSNKNITTMDELIRQYFIQFETCEWQDTNDQGTLDASGITVYGNFDIGHLAGVYKKFGKTNEFEGWYSYDESGNIETVEITEDGETKTVYMDNGSVGRAEAMITDNWKELYGIDFPGSYKGAISDTDKALLINNAETLHGRGDMAAKILEGIGNGTYNSTPRACVDYAESLYQSFGKLSAPWGYVPAGVPDDEAVKWIYSNNKAAPITSETDVSKLNTGDCVLIGDEIYVVLYNNYNEINPTTGKIKGITSEGRVVFATVAGGGSPRLVAFNTETLTKQIGFGMVKYPG